MIILLTSNEQFFRYIVARTSYIQWDDDDVHFLLDQHAWLDFYCGTCSSLKQQSTVKHVVSLLTHYSDSKPIILCSYSLILVATNTSSNFIVFGLTDRVSKPWFAALDASMLTITPPIALSITSNYKSFIIDFLNAYMYKIILIVRFLDK